MNNPLNNPNLFRDGSTAQGLQQLFQTLMKSNMSPGTPVQGAGIPTPPQDAIGRLQGLSGSSNPMARNIGVASTLGNSLFGNPQEMGAQGGGVMGMIGGK